MVRFLVEEAQEARRHLGEVRLVPDAQRVRRNHQIDLGAVHLGAHARPLGGNGGNPGPWLLRGLPAHRPGGLGTM